MSSHHDSPRSAAGQAGMQRYSPVQRDATAAYALWAASHLERVGRRGSVHHDRAANLGTGLGAAVGAISAGLPVLGAWLALGAEAEGGCIHEPQVLAELHCRPARAASGERHPSVGQLQWVAGGSGLARK